MEIVTMYEQLGVSRAVYEYGEAVLRDLRPRFDVIDQTAEYNQGKVLAAMQKNRVNATHFAATTGYGYNDDGRDNLERVYADVFHTEAALVRPQITCGTHALAVALSANLLPGDELLSPVGAPYDTLEEVFGRERNHLDRRSISAVIDSIVYNGLTLNFPLRSNLQVRRFDSHLAPLGIRYGQI